MNPKLGVVSDAKAGTTPVKIAYLDATGELGGAEYLLLRLIEGLPRETIDPMLICSEDGPFPAESRQKGIRTHIVPAPNFNSMSWVLGGRKILNPLAALRNFTYILIGATRLARFLRKERIQILQTNSTFSHIYGGIAARLVQVPCIWYLHDLVEANRLLGTIALVWKGLASCLATRVVGDSYAAIRSLQTGSRAVVIYAGQQESAPSVVAGIRSELNLPPDSRLVGYVGRIAYVKGLDVLVRSAQHVIRENARIHFVLIGSTLFGETGFKRDLVDMIERTELKAHWHWAGHVGPVDAWIQEFDLLVLPSRRETFGLVLLEAAVAGKAAVASRIGGIPEIIADGETGILVPPEDAQDLATAILRLVNDPQLSRKMGSKAKERVKRIFNLQRYYAEFLELYASLLQN